MNAKGIPSRYAISGDMNHMWNQVQIDGEWLNVDVTWNDPVGNDAIDIILETHNTKSTQKYLLKSDETYFLIV